MNAAIRVGRLIPISMPELTVGQRARKAPATGQTGTENPGTGQPGTGETGDTGKGGAA
jgi:hypothetical protein